MSLNFLDFEQPIAELEAKIDSLTAVSRQDEKLDINIDEEVHRLREKSVELTRKIFADLGAWQVAQLARHPRRPYTLDYVRLAFDEFDELAGDRAYADDKAIVGGIARLDGRPVMIIGHQKGRETKEKIRRNFGMPAPEGYRKALRLMEMAERFKMPIITFIDTPGAYPGVGAEERGQSEAIARNLREMSRLSVPVICTVIGEGGSGGALAIGVGDKVNMLQYSTYSVISPEGCASILWKSADKAPLAAEAMGIVAPRPERAEAYRLHYSGAAGRRASQSGSYRCKPESAAAGRSGGPRYPERRRAVKPSLSASDELRLRLILPCVMP
ncbi:Acetyl-coenzyme A carboxylase carboxyl transferase subunit alpha [Raoultella terrigena]|uniref:Acetyl-coenzyme A carboxylase carboxyl transferase subunit alpha n=9 Tax=Enterobacterales TaxID=91347 RepID=A0A485AZA4_RAOTE|nr:Acetyl-coenzyme A carboxylase carboxyl transferase subunit alpha [Raoultella terrigena]